ncbi:hypothetical protein [Mycobacteroides abscessus]|uniref:hypothetical protein n=1 Tax=Mycobacteroides abscessus TaxID=36809 RepID=UPI000DBB3252|nr:hypothetical protein [Mycobacteroides abscessus]BBB42828.1 hypothetical protein MASB_33940 [Mycobacteroides abscessus subsp. bolletii BD]
MWLSDPYIEQEFNGDITISDRLGIDADELGMSPPRCSPPAAGTRRRRGYGVPDE